MTDTFPIAVTVDDVGMEGYSTPQHLRNVVDFWESEGLRGTLFVVPRREGREIGESAQYVELLKEIADRGHELAQHGLDHTRFQTGIPPKMVLDLPHEGPARKYLAQHRDEIEASQSVDKLREVLATGRRILEDALGVPMVGFRAPCLSTCERLFEALETEGYRYDSSFVFQDTAWAMINDPTTDAPPLPITRERFREMQTGGPMRVWPITAEYTWYVKQQWMANFLRLAKHDFDACLAAGIPFVPLCHVSPVQEGDPDQGFELYRRLLGHAREKCGAAGIRLESLTLAELCSTWNPDWE